MRQVSREDGLYLLVVFFSAFLLFSVEFALGKQLLAPFGGAVFVWTTALVFFTSVLAGGYAYVYWLEQVPLERQKRIHVLVVLCALVAQLLSALTWGFGAQLFAQGAQWLMPVWLQVWCALALSAGPGFFILATTAPLMQYWYSIPGREPYRLYAYSNAGSFAALALYPFVIERIVPLSLQRVLWLGGVMVIGVCVWCIARTLPAQDLTPTPERNVVRVQQAGRWLFFATLPAALLVAVSTHITQVIASLPIVWMVPLALYLLSFILAFGGWGKKVALAFASLISVSACYAALLPGFSSGAVSRQMLAVLCMFFVVSWYMHMCLYRERPRVGIPGFYLLVAIGGALGTLFAAIVAPLFAPDMAEFPVLLGIAASVAFFDIIGSLSVSRRFAAGLRGVAVVTVIVATVYAVQHARRDAHYVSRTLYGIVSIRDTQGIRFLTHGTTIHGFQFLDEEKRFKPISYYGRGSGVGRALLFEQTIARGEPISVGVVGLGAGDLAAYCRRHDRFVFYELDPRMEQIARTQFSYLHMCPLAEVRIGDGRLLLERELAVAPGGYDVLVIDAFSDDTVPAHLLTAEAFVSFLGHIAQPRGILALHASNRYIALVPVIERIAREYGLPIRVIEDAGDLEAGVFPSTWVLITAHASTFEANIFAQAPQGTPTHEGALWTDDHADIVGAVRLPALYTRLTDE
jgi:hypothetical protein